MNDQEQKQKEILCQVDKVIKQGPFQDTWESLCAFEVPKWYRNAKFGIFIHWGVFSVPEFEEWYPRHMYNRESPVYKRHLEKYGDLKKHGYKEFIPMFKAEKFDPDEWIEQICESGARYVMPVAEHHDGFQLYDSELSRWNSVQMGPHRDIMGELKEAAEKRGIVFTMSNHRAEHCWFFNYADDDTDVALEENRDFYGIQQKCDHDMSHDIYSLSPTKEHCENWLARQCEMVDKYRPSIVYFDWWVHNIGFKPYLKKFAAYYYNRAAEWGMDVAINYKYNAYVDGAAVYDIERGGLQGLRPDFWQTDTSTAWNSWGYSTENEYKPYVELIEDLVDIVSKNGALLLNIGPRADGSISEDDKRILKGIGTWMKVNGEGIYDTTYWKTYGEGQAVTQEGAFGETKRVRYTAEDIRFTYKKGVLYAFVMKAPENRTVFIKSLALTNPKNGNGSFDVKHMSILGSEAKVTFVRNYEGAVISFDRDIEMEGPLCIKIQLD